jgi:hypothetical protein
MLGQKYVVKKGDTLWNLARKYLGDPSSWPKLYEHNNLPQVIAATGTKITKPGLIFIGQTIYIPPRDIPSAQPKPIGRKPIASANPITGKKPAVPFKGIPFLYKLSKLPKSKVVSEFFVAEIKLSGSITIQRSNASDLLSAGGSKEKLILQSKHEADTALNKLVNQNEIGWNPITKELTFENGIIIYSSVPYSPYFSITANVSSTNGLPGIKATTTCPAIKGKLDKTLYTIADLGIEIELTLRPPSAQPKPVPAPVRAPAAVRKPGWDYLIAGGLLVGSGILIAATIGEDILTGGLGVADDAPSFATASAMFTTGAALLRSRAVPGQYPIKMENGN